MSKKIEPTAKITVVKGKENPFREGSGAYDRVAIVLRAKRVELALGRGARMSTVRKCVELGLVRVA